MCSQFAAITGGQGSSFWPGRGSSSDQHSKKEILTISLRIGDGTFQPEELPDNNLI